MKKTLLVNLFAVILMLSFFECSKDKSDSSSYPEFAIYDGESHPACECVITRIDMVSPETVDTSNWGDPQKVNPPVNDNCPNDDPEISADGNTLYFYWSPDHIVSNEELLTGTTGVYYATKTGGPGDFSTPVFLDLRKGTTCGAADGHPKLTSDSNRIYFHSTRAENTGYQQIPAADDFLDIYTAVLNNNIAEPAINAGAIINSIYPDGEQGISPDDTILYFESVNRPGGLGNGDIYYSVKTGDAWSAPINIGAPVNTSDNEGQVTFAADNPNTMYFTSDRNSIGSAIYRSHFNGTSWGTPELVLKGQVGCASLTGDGSILYFVHVLTDNTPGDPVFDADIYYVVHK